MATNKPAAFTAEIVRRLQIPVAASASADEVAERKPDPAVLRLALARAGATEALAYIGDMPVDAETSRRAGSPFVGVSWGFDPAGLSALGERMVHQPRELVEAIEALGGKKQGQAPDVTGRGGLP